MNISFVLPCYQRFDMFQSVWELTDAFQLRDVEVVLVLDEPTEEKKFIEFAKQTKNRIRLRIVVNDTPHAWRPPCCAINVGIRKALAPFVAIISPETSVVLPRPDYLQSLAAEDYKAAHCGIVWRVTGFDGSESLDRKRRKLMTTENTTSPTYYGLGFLFAPKLAFELVNGFDESRTGYGGDDYCIRFRLARLGVVTRIDGNIKGFTLHHPLDRKQNHDAPRPSTVLYDQPNWGKSFHRVAWDWARI